MTNRFNRFKLPSLTVEDVRPYRDLTGCGIVEAKSHLRKIAARRTLAQLRLRGTLEEKVEFLLDRFAESIQ